MTVSAGEIPSAGNDWKWAPEILSQGIQEARQSTAPTEVTAEHGDVLRTFRIDYHGGERYPHLERDPARPDLLSAILTPKRP